MENFVPFEIAKKLEEKGFDYKCLFVYNKEQIINPEVVKAFGELTDDGYYELTKEGGGKLDWSFVYINEYQLIQYRDVLFAREMIKAPTISQVVSWLEDKKKIFLTVDIEPMGFFFIINYDILTNDNGEYEFNIYNSTTTYPSSIEAALAGIEYVLDNLI
jgi:hypothetical protein